MSISKIFFSENIKNSIWIVFFSKNGKLFKYITSKSNYIIRCGGLSRSKMFLIPFFNFYYLNIYINRSNDNEIINLKNEWKLKIFIFKKSLSKINIWSRKILEFNKY